MWIRIPTGYVHYSELHTGKTRLLVRSLTGILAGPMVCWYRLLCLTSLSIARAYSLPSWPVSGERTCSVPTCALWCRWFCSREEMNFIFTFLLNLENIWFFNILNFITSIYLFIIPAQVILRRNTALVDCQRPSVRRWTCIDENCHQMEWSKGW